MRASHVDKPRFNPSFHRILPEPRVPNRELQEANRLSDHLGRESRAEVVDELLTTLAIKGEKLGKDGVHCRHCFRR